MSVESKLDALLTGQSAILTAVQSLPAANNQQVLDAITAVKTELDTVNTTLGTENPAPTPTPVP